MSAPAIDRYGRSHAYRHGPPPIEARECCDRAGALRLRETIEAYWAARGAVVTVDLVHTGFAASMRGARYDIRSDMINGLPRKQRQQFATREATK